MTRMLGMLTPAHRWFLVRRINNNHILAEGTLAISDWLKTNTTLTFIEYVPPTAHFPDCQSLLALI